MYRGTTPTIIFSLPFSVDAATKLSVVFAQQDTIIIEKKLSDCSIEGKKITVNLTQAETLNFNSLLAYVDMQIRLELNGKVMASNIMTTTVNKIIKEGAL